MGIIPYDYHISYLNEDISESHIKWRYSFLWTGRDEVKKVNNEEKTATKDLKEEKIH